MTHLNDSEFVDLVEERLAADRRRHAAECEACRVQADVVRAALALARADAAPEPSPLFWEHFSARVSEAVGAQRRPWSAWGLWLRDGGLQWAAAVAAVVLVAGLTWRTVVKTDPSTVHTAPGLAAGASAAADEYLADDTAADAWDAILLATDELEIDETETLGIRVRPGAAERLAEELTPEERRELARLIDDEIKRSGA